MLRGKDASRVDPICGCFWDLSGSWSCLVPRFREEGEWLGSREDRQRG